MSQLWLPAASVCEDRQLPTWQGRLMVFTEPFQLPSASTPLVPTNSYPHARKGEIRDYYTHASKCYPEMQQAPGLTRLDAW